MTGFLFLDAFNTREVKSKTECSKPVSIVFTFNNESDKKKGLQYFIGV